MTFQHYLDEKRQKSWIELQSYFFPEFFKRTRIDMKIFHARKISISIRNTEN